jgi:quercetin dioxygenase-like cupin family protein
MKPASLRPKEIIMKILHILGSAIALAIAAAAPAMAHGTGDKVTTNFDAPIPNISGKSLTALVVDYPPDGASPAHVHAKSAFIYAYVLSGEIESKVNDEPARIYKAGESFFEPPGSAHPISRNASKTKPARLLAVFIVDTNDRELTTASQQEGTAQ